MKRLMALVVLLTLTLWADTAAQAERLADVPVLPDMQTTLRWPNPPGTTQIHLQVIPYQGEGPGVDLILGSVESFTLPPPPTWYGLLPDMGYTWRVRSSASNSPAGTSDPSWSAWGGGGFRTPKIGNDAFPLNPPDGGTAPGILDLQWTADPRVFYFEFQVSTDPAFNTDPTTATAAVSWLLIHGGVGTVKNSVRATGLPLGSTQFWRVRPRIQGDGTALPWSRTWSFTVQATAPAPTPTATPTPAPTATPTPTATATPTPVPCNTRVQAVVDPSFENNSAAWTLSGNAVRTTAGWNSGRWSIRLGGNNNATGSDFIGQRMPVPAWAEKIVIYYAWYMLSTETGGVADLMTVALGSGGNELASDYGVWNTYTRGQWYVRRWAPTGVDVKALRGSILNLAIGAFTDASFPTTWWVDDVEVWFTCGAQVAGVADDAAPIAMGPRSHPQD